MEQNQEQGHEHHGWAAPRVGTETTMFENGESFVKFDCPLCGVTIMKIVRASGRELLDDIANDLEQDHVKLHEDAEAARQAKNFVEYLKGRQ
jgi:predicted RNA-binding Zn-ribbon protein involved in translation (DUF1610 family)